MKNQQSAKIDKTKSSSTNKGKQAAAKTVVTKKPTSKPQVVAKQKIEKKASVKTTETEPTAKINKVEKKPIQPAAQNEKKMTTKNNAGPKDFSPYLEASGEEYMNKNQLEHFREILNLWKEQLHADRDATVQHMQDDAMNFPDILDRAVLEEEHKLEWQAREREHKLINKIDLALARIKQGDYGYCDECGAEIGIRRLEARPTATQCIDCKTIDEIRERQTGIVE